MSERGDDHGRGHAHGDDPAHGLAHEHAHGHEHEHAHEHDDEHVHVHVHEHEHACGVAAASNELLARGAGVGRVLYLDAPSGLAGDMIVAALLDLGVPESVIREGLAGLALDGYSLQISTVRRASLAGRHFAVNLAAPQPSRTYADIVQLLARATLPEGARAIALRAFEVLARAEATVHACAIEEVHFHEVGAVDSIVDTVAAALAFDHLGAEVICSPLPLARGSTRSEHGVIPLPAPATVLCLQGVPTYDAGDAGELVTPTGACLVAAVAHGFGGWPSFAPERVGMGAGTKQRADRPNLLRAVLGRPSQASFGATRSQGLHVVLEANIDDMSPELAAFALQRALEAGALDAWTTPIGMKKGRPALTLSVLCRNDKLDELAKVLLSETTTLGLRHYPVDRIERPRRFVTVETAFGPIQMKVADGDGLDEQAAPEYEACRRAAEEHEVPIRKVYAAALTAWSMWAAIEAQRPKP